MEITLGLATVHHDGSIKQRVENIVHAFMERNSHLGTVAKNSLARNNKIN